MPIYVMSRNYTINLLDNNLSLFFNQNPNELVICKDNFCCFNDWIVSDISLNNLDKCFYSICNESDCKVFKGNNKQYQNKPDSNNPNKFNVNLMASDFKKDFKQSSNGTTTCKDSYCCFNGAIANDIILNDIDKCFYSICGDSYCKIFKGSNKQFKSKENTGESKEDQKNQSTSESTQDESSSSKPSPSTSSVNSVSSVINRKLAVFFSVSLLCNLLL